MPTPDLTDPAARAAYLAELRHVGQGARVGGMALAALGVVLALLRAYWLPRLPELVPLAMILLALGMMLVGTVRRIRWQLARMRG